MEDVKIVEYQKKELVVPQLVSIHDSRYYRVYTLMIQMEETLRTAKGSLLRGESPYVTLGYLGKLANKAQDEWHMQKEQEESES